MNQGVIATFYSYKGGVGRTFALANVGAALAGWGYKVLCIDWDLEAPGLCNYLRVEKSQRGLVELVGGIREGKSPPWRDYITKANLSAGVELDVLTAGAQDDTYIDRFQEIGWASLYEDGGLAQILEEWRADWQATYDFVLIDSRTGITDIGALCTAHLPDLLLVFFTASRQSVEGCVTVVKRAQDARKGLPFDRSALLVLPVASRFDSREEYEKAQWWRSFFIEQTQVFYEAWATQGTKADSLLDRTTIPYVAYWSFGEQLPIIEETSRGPQTISSYLETIAALVSHRFGKSELLLQSPGAYVDAAAQGGHRKSGFKYDVYLDCAPELSDKAAELHECLLEKGLAVFRPATGTLSGSSLTKELEQAIDTSQSAILLLGREPHSRINSIVRRFAILALDEQTDRKLLPVAFFPGAALQLPSIFRDSIIEASNEWPLDALANRLEGILPSRSGSAAVSTTSTELGFALTQLQSKDPLTCLAALKVIERLGTIGELPALGLLAQDPDERVRTLVKRVERSLLEGFRGGAKPFLNLSFEQLKGLAASSDESRRLQSAVLLGGHKGPAARNLLLTLLGDDAASVREATAKALGDLNDAGALDWLVPRMDDTDEDVRTASTKALIGIDGENSSRVVLERLKKASYSDDVIMSAAFESWSRRADAIAVNALLQVYGRNFLQRSWQQSWQQSWQRSWQSMNPETAMDLLRSRIGDPAATIREVVASALGCISSEQAGDALIELLSDKEASVRVAAVQQLGRLGGEWAVNALMVTLSDKAASVRVAAVEQLGRVGGEQAVAALMGLLSDKEASVRVAAVQQVGRVGGEQVVDALMGLLSDKDASVRVAAVQQVGRVGGEQAVASIKSLLSDKDTDVRVAAVEQIGQAGGQRAVELLVGLLSAKESEIRELSLVHLSRIGGNIVQQYAKVAFRDNVEHVRRAAVAAYASQTEDRTEQRLLSQDFDAMNPWIDPKRAINPEMVKRASERLHLSEDEIRAKYVALNTMLDGVLTLTWGPQNST